MAPEPPIVQLITSRAAQLRGELRNKMIPIVQSAYGFRSGQDRKSLKHNRKLIDELGYIPGPGFIFKGSLQGTLPAPSHSEGHQHDVVHEQA
ncbi:hypothetical protein BC834DRAFT_972618 [Gloeopeniophorella convolvens]|nr:hypothetical protein BC834DRAFT_972618 [Gloeopeniophorella convolvens]